jgi:hypothetical protein
MSLKHIDPKTGMPPSSSPEEYQFIMESPQKKRQAPGGKMGIIFIAIIALSLMIGLLVALTSNMSSADEEVATQLTIVAVKQNEIINIAKNGTQNAKTLASRNIASTTYLSMVSQQNDFFTICERPWRQHKTSRPCIKKRPRKFAGTTRSRTKQPLR